jgi:hypothetical protein
MTSNPISPLRQRMINDMNVRNFVPDTQREYIRAVKNRKRCTVPTCHGAVKSPKLSPYGT